MKPKFREKKLFSIIIGQSCSGKEYLSKTILAQNYDLTFSSEIFHIRTKRYLEDLIAFLNRIDVSNVLCDGYPLWKKRAINKIKRVFKNLDFYVTYGPCFLLAERQGRNWIGEKKAWEKCRQILRQAILKAEEEK